MSLPQQRPGRVWAGLKRLPADLERRCRLALEQLEKGQVGYRIDRVLKVLPFATSRTVEVMELGAEAISEGPQPG